MRITQRQAAIGLQILLLAGTLAILIFQIITGDDLSAIITSAIGFAIGSTVLFFYWRGWKYAPYVVIVTGVVLSALIPPDATLTRETVLSFLIPPIIALILGRPALILASAIGTPLLLYIRSQGQGWDADIPIIVIFVMVTGGMALARVITDNTQRESEANALRVEAERARAEQQARDLAAANQQLEAQLDQQRQLLDLVAALETPAMPLAAGVLFAPIVGHMDTRRAQAITRRLLAEASTQRARMVILDIAGVSAIDTAVARGLLDTAQALRLLGCEVTISGISSAVALTLVNLDIDLQGVATARSPQEALAGYLGQDTKSDQVLRKVPHRDRR
jgi:anti-anti-sigma regulatory factor